MVNVASKKNENNVIKPIDFRRFPPSRKANIYFHDNAIQEKKFSHKSSRENGLWQLPKSSRRRIIHVLQ